MFNYEVTYNQFGQIVTRWFDDAQQAKRHAKHIAKMGYWANVTRYDAGDYTKREYVWEKSLATTRWMAGHS
jgi:hypothetical protein